MPYDLGDVVPLSVETRDQDGELADAGAIALTVRLPDLTEVTPSITNPSTGVYRCDFTPTVPGPYAVKWVATGVNASSYKDAFDVRDDYPPMLFSLADARAILNKSSTADGDKIRDFIESTTSIVETIVGPVVPRSVSEVIYGCSLPYFVTRTAPVISLTSIESVYIGGLPYDVDDFDVDTESGICREKRGQSFAGTYRVTYQAGRTVVPAAIRDAGRLIMKWLWGTHLGPHSGTRDRMQPTIPGSNPEVRMSREIPQAAIELLRPYALPGGFA